MPSDIQPRRNHGSHEATSRAEIDLPEGIADELKEYARWVELSSAVTTADAMSKTVQFGLRDVFRRDRMWQEHRRGGAPQDSAGSAEPAPASDAKREAAKTNTAPPRSTPAPSPSPSLPPPSAATSPRATRDVEI